MSNKGDVLWGLLADQDMILRTSSKKALESLEINSIQAISELDDSMFRKIREKFPEFSENDMKTLRDAKFKIKRNYEYFKDEFKNRLNLDIRPEPDEIQFIEAYGIDSQVGFLC
jgi:hypothetical protein